MHSTRATRQIVVVVVVVRAVLAVLTVVDVVFAFTTGVAVVETVERQVENKRGSVEQDEPNDLKSKLR